jgi:hypothetical protein
LSWVQNKLSLSRLAIAALLVTGAASAAANVLVVRSSGPSAKSFPPGRSLPDNSSIALRAGDTVIVLDSRGTRTFRGPGDFNPSVAATASATTVVGSTGRRARIGAVRSAGIVPASPTTIWHIDVAQGGTMCLADPGNVMLWRADPSRATTVSIAGPGGASRQLSWPAGAATARWPTDLPVTANADYQLRQAGVAAPATVRFKPLQLPSPPGDMAAVAQALIENGCQEQLDLLVDSAPPQ